MVQRQHKNAKEQGVYKLAVHDTAVQAVQTGKDLISLEPREGASVACMVAAAAVQTELKLTDQHLRSKPRLFSHVLDGLVPFLIIGSAAGTNKQNSR